MTNFVHLHCHSNYSFMEGASRVGELVTRARDCGMPALALTDTNGLYGAVPFVKAAREAGIMPILGAEFRGHLRQGFRLRQGFGGQVSGQVGGQTRLDENFRRPPADNEGQTRTGRFVALARNREGYRKLCRLITSLHLEGGDGAFPSPVRRVIAEGDSDLYLIIPARLARTRAAGKKALNMYLEIPSTAGPAGIARLAGLAAHLGVPPVATGPVVFSTPDRYEVHHILTAIRTNTTVETVPKSELAPRGAWFRTPSEMRRLFSARSAALENAARIAGDCDAGLDLGDIHLPRLLQGFGGQVGGQVGGQARLRIGHGETPHSRLRRFCLRGLAARYRPLTLASRKRLRHELGVIEKFGFSDYFLVVHDIVREARSRGIPVIGRGSAAGSIVSYCLGITHIDPLRHDLYFERFLNPGRRSPPDIDLDFSWKRRDEIIDYVYRTHGADHVAMIATLVTFGARSGVREVGKALGVPEEDLSRWAGSLPHAGAASIEKAVRLLPECRGLPLDREPLSSIVRLAGKIDGYPRHLGVHAGGIVIAPFPLTDIVPLERAAKGVIVTQCEMRAAAEMGLVKIDILGQRSLAVIEDTVAAVDKNYGVLPPTGDFEIVSHDKKTVELIRSGRTMGCFYIESPAMRRLLRKLDVTSYEELIAASSVIRPGVAGSGMMRQYIRRHRGREETNYLHPGMREILAETHGVMIYQEDVMRVARFVAGMTLAEADLLRRAMSGKMRSRDAMNTLRQGFADAAAGRGIARKTAKEIWHRIESFVAYAFCKAHSASYALLSLRVAYLKAHWPAEFLAAVISNGGGFYHAQAYLDEARRLGIKIILPDINRSEIPYSAGPGWIRVGLMQVKGLRGETMEQIVASRKRNGFFTSLTEFRRRVGPDRREAENLVLCGAFDAFELSRPELLWKLRIPGAGEDGREQPPLQLLPSHALPRNIVPRIPEHDESTRHALERKVLGIHASLHPLDALRNRIPDNGYISARELVRHTGKRVALLGWLVCAKRVLTSRGEYMRFVTMEDRTDTFEAILFPRCYRRYGHLLRSPGPFEVRGRVENDDGCAIVNADRLRLIVIDTLNYS